MILIPGILIAIVTFPGVIVHEAAHMWFCKLRKVPVIDVCFFRFGNPVGYVIHGDINNFNTVFLVSVGPFIINSLLCIIICLPAFMPVRIFGVVNYWSYFTLWLGISIGMHAIPSSGDAQSLMYYAKKELPSGNILAIVSLPLVIIIFIANALRMVWADYLYGFTIGLLLPELILRYVL